ncbi:tyrosine-type recombinase/integrase [Actinomadura sp. B10D3]|uniref:tyrosine-type recombinase/integrase n=1 Tax=Actinomadura sp. B10D3 TaxID=3153557 RepID=UPI00325E9244
MVPLTVWLCSDAHTEEPAARTGARTNRSMPGSGICIHHRQAVGRQLARHLISNCTSEGDLITESFTTSDRPGGDRDDDRGGDRVAEVLAGLQLGLCGACGRARYGSRRQARHAARVGAPGVRLRAYRYQLVARARETLDPKLRAKVKGQRLVGAATKHRIRATLRSALAKAVRERLIDINVAALVELPSGKAPKALVWTEERINQWQHDFAAHIETMNDRRRRLSRLEPHKRIGQRINRLDAYIGAPRPSRVMVWTPALTRAFLERARGHRLYAQFHLIAFRGLRRGESCGLRWTDLDLTGGTATIRWQITQIGPDTFEVKPKTDAGEATINLDKTTIKELRAHKVRQNTERLTASAAWTETGFVFTTPTGGPVDPNDVTEEFEQLSMEAGLPPVRLHDLRHGAATFLLAAGYGLKVVQETLRLSSLAIAADIYTSVLPQLARQSAEDAAAVVLGNHRPRRGRPGAKVTEIPPPSASERGMAEDGGEATGQAANAS